MIIQLEKIKAMNENEYVYIDIRDSKDVSYGAIPLSYKISKEILTD